MGLVGGVAGGCLHVQVVDVVPYYFDRLLVLVDVDGEPDVPALP